MIRSKRIDISSNSSLHDEATNRKIKQNMFKSIIIFGVLFAATANAGLIETHHVVEPAVAHVGSIVHSAPSAVSHQSITQVHNKDIVQPVVAPIVKTTHLVSPVVHAAPLPVVKTTLHHAAAAPIYQTYASAPVVHSIPVVHSAPLFKTFASAPVAYALHH